MDLADRCKVSPQRVSDIGIHMVSTFSRVQYGSSDQPGMVANPTRGELSRIFFFASCPGSRLEIWSRLTGPAVPSRASLLISILRLNLVLAYGIPPAFRDGIQIDRPPVSGQSLLEFRVLEY